MASSSSLGESASCWKCQCRKFCVGSNTNADKVGILTGRILVTVLKHLLGTHRTKNNLYALLLEEINSWNDSLCIHFNQDWLVQMLLCTVHKELSLLLPFPIVCNIVRSLEQCLCTNEWTISRWQGRTISRLSRMLSTQTDLGYRRGGKAREL
jgi:hypothetical protein